MGPDPSSPAVDAWIDFLVWFIYWQSPKGSSINAVISSATASLKKTGASQGDYFEAGGRAHSDVLVLVHLPQQSCGLVVKLYLVKRERHHMCRQWATQSIDTHDCISLSSQHWKSQIMWTLNLSFPFQANTLGYHLTWFTQRSKRDRTSS